MLSIVFKEKNFNKMMFFLDFIKNALGCTLNDLVCDIESSNEQKSSYHNW